jgi:hypothetical protein
MMLGVTWFHVSIVVMRVLTDPVGPGLVVFCGLERDDRFAAASRSTFAGMRRSWPYG